MRVHKLGPAQERARAKAEKGEDDRTSKKRGRQYVGGPVKREPDEREHQPSLIEQPVVNAAFVCKHAAHKGRRGRKEEREAEKGKKTMMLSASTQPSTNTKEEEKGSQLGRKHPGKPA